MAENRFKSLLRFCTFERSSTKASQLQSDNSLSSVSMTINEWLRSVQWRTTEAKEGAANGRLVCSSCGRTIPQMMISLATGPDMSGSAEGTLPG
ncbi:hypothetical protein T10_5447 [Trichinella papuae]|uniref:Uncharacterized protein n=1 Tax=Trichinella papuae TaxID=268474 RepID=A0A0V1N7T4_9BILA|nr:hypothetical protein T10_5447 [Trichinella papuae]